MGNKLRYSNEVLIDGHRHYEIASKCGKFERKDTLLHEVYKRIGDALWVVQSYNGAVGVRQQFNSKIAALNYYHVLQRYGEIHNGMKLKFR